MHVFQIRGFSGLLVLLLAALSVVLLALLLPASFMMVLWNALVFEGFRGPEVNLYQGFLLWGFVLMMIKVIFKPEIKFEFQKMQPGKPKAQSAKTTVVKMEESAEKPEESDAKPAEPVVAIVEDASSSSERTH